MFWQVPWSCYLVAFHRETQGTLFTLLVPFRNVISERRMLQNKSGEIYGRKSGESGESEKWRNFWSKVEKFMSWIQSLVIKNTYVFIVYLGNNWYSFI